MRYASTGVLDQNQQSNMLAHLSTQVDIPKNAVNSGTFDPNVTKTQLHDTGSITTELRDTKLTFEMVSNLNETTTMDAEIQKDNNLKVPSSRGRRHPSQPHSEEDSINSSSFNGTRGPSRIDPEPEYRRQKVSLHKAQTRAGMLSLDKPKERKKSSARDKQGDQATWEKLSKFKHFRQKFTSYGEDSPLDIRTSMPVAGATFGYEFMGDQVRIDRPDSCKKEDGLTGELQNMLLAEDWSKQQATH